MAVITISRQYGSGGDEIADRVGETLGYPHFDKSMITKAASETRNTGTANRMGDLSKDAPL